MVDKKNPVTSAARLKQLYNSKYASELLKELELHNFHQVPRIEKVVLNIGLGRGKDDKKLMQVAENTLCKITGQQPVETFAKQSIAGFKLREGNKIGLKVTLRDQRMYEFVDRLVNVVLPRLRDFHGVSNKSFDPSGNFCIGINDQSVFPELSFDETTTSHGLQAVFVISCQRPGHAKALLIKFGVPFEKPQGKPFEKLQDKPIERPHAAPNENKETK